MQSTTWILRINQEKGFYLHSLQFSQLERRKKKLHCQRIAFAVGVLLLAMGTSAQEAPSQKPTLLASVEGPITGGDHDQPFGAPAHVPDAYVMQEYFLSGIATAYEPAGRWGPDGIWEAKPTIGTHYHVRMLVLRPTDARRFNGIVVVEWLNVSAGFEGAADYVHMNAELTREGYAWVGIGAQAVGVNAPKTGLKAWDARRYGSLVQPGDAWSYDIFSQAGRALRALATTIPLQGLRVRKLLATGRSQSAQRLLTYVNAVHPAARVYDGFLIHDRGAYAAALGDGYLLNDGGSPATARVRADLDAPVLELQTEYDVLSGRAYLTRQAPSARYRRWEVAGASHAEIPIWVVEPRLPLDLGPGCKDPVNTAPQHAVVKAALHALMRWSQTGIAPRQSSDIKLSDSTDFPVAVRDQYGNAKGGIRLPELEAPTAALDGRPNTALQSSTPYRCATFGHTVVFDKQILASLYPTHEAFVRRFRNAVRRIVRDGFWLRPEANEALRAAQRSLIGRLSDPVHTHKLKPCRPSPGHAKFPFQRHSNPPNQPVAE